MFSVLRSERTYENEDHDISTEAAFRDDSDFENARASRAGKVIDAMSEIVTLIRLVVSRHELLHMHNRLLLQLTIR